MKSNGLSRGKMWAQGLHVMLGLAQTDNSRWESEAQRADRRRAGARRDENGEAGGQHQRADGREEGRVRRARPRTPAERA